MRLLARGFGEALRVATAKRGDHRLVQFQQFVNADPAAVAAVMAVMAANAALEAAPRQ